MNFRTYWDLRSPESRLELAEDTGVSVEHLRHIAHGVHPPGPKLALRIERATEGLISRHMLRPDIYPIHGCGCPVCRPDPETDA